MNKAKCIELGNAIEAALKPVAAKFGLLLQVMGGSYSDTGLKPRIEFKTHNAGQVAFANNAWTIEGLSAHDFGKEFSTPSGRYRLSGINPRSSNWPIEADRITDGKRVRFAESIVKVIRRDNPVAVPVAAPRP